MARAIADLYERVRHLVPELAKFGVVGGIGAVIDLGGAAVLQYHVGPLKAKAISITAATLVTYLGSRFWTFRHRENQAVHREAVLFIVLNVIGLVIAEIVIAITTYGLDLRGALAYNAASVAGTGLGTIFRFYAYRKWVFLAPAQDPARPAAPARAMGEEVPDFPPWELDPAYFDRAGEHSGHVPLDDPFAPNGRVTSPLVAAATVPMLSAPVREDPEWDVPAPAWQGTGREAPAWETPAGQSPAWDSPAWDSLGWESPGGDSPGGSGQEREAPDWAAPAWETPAWESRSTWDEGPSWEAPSPASSAAAADSAADSPRAPGRHRKR